VKMGYVEGMNIFPIGNHTERGGELVLSSQIFLF